MLLFSLLFHLLTLQLLSNLLGNHRNDAEGFYNWHPCWGHSSQNLGLCSYCWSHVGCETLQSASLYYPVTCKAVESFCWALQDVQELGSVRKIPLGPSWVWHTACQGALQVITVTAPKVLPDQWDTNSPLTLPSTYEGMLLYPLATCRIGTRHPSMKCL